MINFLERVKEAQIRTSSMDVTPRHRRGLTVKNTPLFVTCVSDSDPHGSFSKADRFGLQRQHLCDEQQGSHKGEMFAGKACIFWWPISSVLPERNRKEKATGTVGSVWQLSNRSSIAAEIRTTTSNY